MDSTAPEPHQHFAACPHCAQPARPCERSLPFQCAACGFVLFFNPAAAVAAFIRRDDGRVLFTRRAKEPGKGRLGLPGGFVDFEETAEEALRREVREEVGLEVDALEYLVSFPNRYTYKGVTYNTLDLFFVAKAAQAHAARALDAVESLCWVEPSRVDLEQIAFGSMRDAVRMLRGQGRG